MFSVGDLVVYGSMGVCTITDIGVPDMPGATQPCYVLRPHYVANSKVYAPIGNCTVKMRTVLSCGEAQGLIDSMPQIKEFATDKERQELHELYRSAIRSADAFMLAKLLKTLYSKRQHTLQQRKTVPSAEKEYFDTAEKMLYGEFAAALDIPLSDVEDYIAQRLQPGYSQAHTAAS